MKKDYILSVYFGFHDSCITFSTMESIVLHLEAERYFRKKHLRLTSWQMCELIKSGLDYLDLSINDVSSLYVAGWNNQFGNDEVVLFGKKFKPIITAHHENHLGTGFPSKFKKAVIVCADGGSEDGTTKIYYKNDDKISFVEDLDNTVSTGKFYGTITQMVIDPRFGRAHDTYPGKTMGLAAFGFYDQDIARKIHNKRYEINKLHIDGCGDLLREFGLSDDYSAPWLDSDRKNLAATAQKYWLDEFVKNLNRHTNFSSNIILTGGCALNVSLNSLLIDSGLYSKVYVSPVSGDSGQSLGAILYHNPRVFCDYPFLGRSFGEFDELDKNTRSLIIKDLLDNKIIAWYQGRSEIGARALGHRSFLGLPYSTDMRTRLSVNIKKREEYRPVAGLIPKECLADFFQTNQESPFMTFAPKALSITKELAPAIVHADGTCRIQTVDQKDNPVIYNILIELGKKTGVPILMNTSFNINGEPIVDTPEEAKNTFFLSGADILYINGKRHEQKN